MCYTTSKFFIILYIFYKATNAKWLQYNYNAYNLIALKLNKLKTVVSDNIEVRNEGMEIFLGEKCLKRCYFYHMLFHFKFHVVRSINMNDVKIDILYQKYRELLNLFDDFHMENKTVSIQKLKTMNEYFSRHHE